MIHMPGELLLRFRTVSNCEGNYDCRKRSVSTLIQHVHRGELFIAPVSVQGVETAPTVQNISVDGPPHLRKAIRGIARKDMGNGVFVRDEQDIQRTEVQFLDLARAGVVREEPAFRYVVTRGMHQFPDA